MAKIGLATDSTADFEPAWYRDNNVIMVPLSVRFGDEVFRDWVDITPPEFYKRLKTATELPKTSQPSVAAFISAYRELSESVDEIISVHISSKLSGTIGSAGIAAREAPVPVTVIDTGQASLATGLIVRELASVRDRGASSKELMSLAGDIAAKMHTFFYVDTLKYLEMGGRLGKAGAIVGALLNIKVILKMDSGEVAPAARVRGRGKVFSTMVGLVEQYFDRNKARFGFANANCLEDMARLKEELGAAGFNVGGASGTDIGAVTGAYTGPGAFAVVAY